MNDSSPQHKEIPRLPFHKKIPLVIRYKECMKNHAASIGGTATDGCGEFMPGGGDPESDGSSSLSLICSACNCHRNFHRKEFECEECNTASTIPFCCYNPHPADQYHPLLGHHHLGLRKHPCLRDQQGVMVSNRSGSTTVGLSECNDEKDNNKDKNEDGNDDNVAGQLAARANGDSNNNNEKMAVMMSSSSSLSKKRFRTKFSTEQKDKMLGFAEKAGWTIQKLDESDVQQFCQEIGITRRVLKVWMHNNKHTISKKINGNNP